MPQATCSPSVPPSAAQRGGEWSVPRSRQVLAVTGSANPSGTMPPCERNSATEKSTRKLAQQAPQRWQSGASSGQDGVGLEDGAGMGGRAALGA